MPKTKNSGAAKQKELPETLQRSEAKAQQTFAKAYDSAIDEYGDEARAHQVAYAALKHTYQKVGDHWEPKESKGPSDERAKNSSDPNAQTRGGVDANATKDELLKIARKLEISGRSKMRKSELVNAIEDANERETQRSRRNNKS